MEHILGKGIFEIGRAMAGSTMMHLDLEFLGPIEMVKGHGRITQAVNPPVDVKTQATGTYSIMTVMPNNTHIQVRMNGFEPIFQPRTAPLEIKNFECVMVLNKDMREGTCTYSYMNQFGHWVEERNQPVRLLNKSGSLQEVVQIEAANKAVAAK